MYISEEIGHSKPKSEAFVFVLQDLGLAPEHAVMVGDSLEYDVKGAEQAGIRGVLIDHAAKFRDYRGMKIQGLSELAPLIFR
jgi:putative hydrolase of the HAD superfamily